MTLLVGAQALFDLCEDVLRSFLAQSPDTEYMLVRNDCTHIVRHFHLLPSLASLSLKNCFCFQIYESGGFFNAHQVRVM
jgi:hypothetical protein